ncbi:MAG: YraN family protein [Bacteroidales bacterium]|nr:YraN family protein [Bacteroidales bacterium]
METTKKRTGNTGEEIAADYLISKGYRILERNWRAGHWEIDLIAENDRWLVIVEVKTRKSTLFGEPEDFVTLQKQRNLIRAAANYIWRTQQTKEVRFDIISVVLQSGVQGVKHIEDAFQPRW